MAEKDLKNLTNEELIEKCVILQAELRQARSDRDISKKMYDRLYTKLKTIENILEL